jgi:hypothetical protein
MNLLNAALNNLAGSQTPSPQLQGDSSQSNAIFALILGFLTAHPITLNTSFMATSQSNSAVPSLLTLMYRLVEEGRQRRAQADATQNAIMATIGRILGQGMNMIDEEERQRMLLSALEQTLRRTNNNDTAQNQQGILAPPSAHNLKIEANSNAAILQAAKRDEAAQLAEDTHSQQGNRQGGQSDDFDDYNARHLSSQRKRKFPEMEDR